MNWLADNARFTLIYKHLASRNRTSGIPIGEQSQHALSLELQTAHQSSWGQWTGKQKLLRMVGDKTSAGQSGLQPKHWFEACRTIRQSPARFGHVIIIALLLFAATFVHTHYLLFELNHQFMQGGIPFPALSAWILTHGMLVAMILTVLIAGFSLLLKGQHRAIRYRIDTLNLSDHWLIPKSLRHCNIAVCGFLLSKLSYDELKDYLPKPGLARIESLIERNELKFMSQDPDCAELIWQQHIQAALNTSMRCQKRLTYLAYLSLASWLCVLLLGVIQAYIDWGKLSV